LITFHSSRKISSVIEKAVANARGRIQRVSWQAGFDNDEGYTVLGFMGLTASLCTLGTIGTSLASFLSNATTTESSETSSQAAATAT